MTIYETYWASFIELEHVAQRSAYRCGTRRILEAHVGDVQPHHGSCAKSDGGRTARAFIAQRFINVHTSVISFLCRWRSCTRIPFGAVMCFLAGRSFAVEEMIGISDRCRAPAPAARLTAHHHRRDLPNYAARTEAYFWQDPFRGWRFH